MTANTAIEIALFAGVIPAAVALVVCMALRWFLPESVSRRYVPGAPFALAVFAGFALSPSTTSLVPSQFWGWVPYVGLLAALVAAVTGAAGVLRVERWLGALLVCILAAWLIVPTWGDLSPSRPMQIAGLAAGMFLVATTLDSLALRAPGRAVPFWLMASAATSSALIMVDVSETFGTLAALPAGALAGCGVAAMLTKNSPADYSLALPFALVVGAYAFVGYVYPSPPLLPLLLVPAVPLTLWLCAIGPLSRFAGWRAAAIQAACVLLPLATIAVIVLFGRESGEDAF